MGGPMCPPCVRPVSALGLNKECSQNNIRDVMLFWKGERSPGSQDSVIDAFIPFSAESAGDTALY
jgi:hypothetical protein